VANPTSGRSYSAGKTRIPWCQHECDVPSISSSDRFQSINEVSSGERKIRCKPEFTESREVKRGKGDNIKGERETLAISNVVLGNWFANCLVRLDSDQGLEVFLRWSFAF